MSGILGTPAASVASDLNLLLQIIVLILLFVGFKFSRKKAEGSLKTHGRIMTIVVVLNLMGFVGVMGPSFFIYFSQPQVRLLIFPSLSTLTHAVFGAIAEVVSIAFIFNKKPKNIRLWMRILLGLWIASALSGITVYLQIAGVIT